MPGGQGPNGAGDDSLAAQLGGMQEQPAGPEGNGPPAALPGVTRWEQLAVWHESGDMDLAATRAALPGNDQDTAALIARKIHPGLLHYVPGHPTGTWRVWDGTHHREDDSGQIGAVIARYAHDAGVMLTHAFQQLRAVHGDDKDALAKELEKWEPARKYAAGLKRSAGHRALRYLLGETSCATSASEFTEHHPRLLNCLNWTVDLQTGRPRPHDPADMLTYCVPVEYHPDAPPPEKFCQLVWRMTGGSPPVFSYVMRALGYTLLGENPEQVIFFLNGPTKSGKSQLLYIVRQLLGELAHESQADLITVTRNGRNARTENSVRGKRIFTITETSGFMNIDEGQLKRLTGEPVISVDRHYAQERLKTPVTFTGWVATNDMPMVTNYDDAMNERVIVIPCGPTIPADQRDRRLAEQILAEEAEGVLAYLVRECVAYHAPVSQGGGLVMPAEVIAETARYRGQQATAASFAAECCLAAPGGGWIGMTDARSHYLAWMARRGSGTALPLQAFYDHMEALPGVVREDNGGSVRRFHGLVWNQEALARLGVAGPGR
jgi:putative DNA primase/helicase